MTKERYQRVKKLGEGATAEVFLVWDELLHRNMAVKCGREKSLLLAEANVLARISHRAFPVLYDYRESEEESFLFLEYIEGENLRERRERIGRYTQQEVLRIVCRVAEAVLFLHESSPGFLYGDIKPENILMQPDGAVRLVDLGTAVPLQEETKGIEKQAGGVALPGDRRLRGGTLKFAPPENWQGRPDVRSDIYALGRLMQTLLDEDGREGGSAAVRRIVERCTQKNPNGRYKSMREFLTAVQRC